MNRSLHTLALRLKHARQLRGLSQTGLAESSRLKQSDISKLETGKMMKTTEMARLSTALGVTAEWLQDGDGVGPEGVENFTPTAGTSRQAKAQAHRLSDLYVTVEPSEIDWGDVVGKQLPKRFTLRARDNSMAPLLSKGQRGVFTTAGLEDPPAGRPVLVKDGEKNLYIREFRPRTPTHWQAMASPTSGYEALDSIRDRLVVVARMVGVLWDD